MEEKQKAIKAAYGKYYDSQCDDFGWVRFRPQFKNGESWHDAFPLDISETSPGIFRYRPQSLRGIEDNKGWICINSEDDLPKEKGNYWVMDKILAKNPNQEFFDPNALVSMNERWMHRVSHYQPIIKPEHPIY